MPRAEEGARIEIIPLIDIMFFLLAAFMLVSLSMVNLRGVRVELPAASSAAGGIGERDTVQVSVDRQGGLFLDGKPVTARELTAGVADARRGRPALTVVVGGDQDARHGDIVRALDLVRAAGVERVALQTRAASGQAVGDGR